MMPSWNVSECLFSVREAGFPYKFQFLLQVFRSCELSSSYSTCHPIVIYLEMKLPFVSCSGDLVILADNNIVSFKEITEKQILHKALEFFFFLNEMPISPCIFIWYVILASKRIFFHPLIILLSIGIKVIIIVIIVVVPVIVVIQTIFFITRISRPVNL